MRCATWPVSSGWEIAGPAAPGRAGNRRTADLSALGEADHGGRRAEFDGLTTRDIAHVELPHHSHQAARHIAPTEARVRRGMRSWCQHGRTRSWAVNVGGRRPTARRRAESSGGPPAHSGQERSPRRRLHPGKSATRRFRTSSVTVVDADVAGRSSDAGAAGTRSTG
jgi:hypothetical protein